MKRIITTTLTAVAAALSITTAAPAEAQSSELVYLELLNLRGVTIRDTALAIKTGYETCAMLNYATGDQVIPRMMARYYDMNVIQAGIVLVSAVEALCPWHDHRGETVT